MEYKCAGLQQTARSTHLTSSRATGELCLTSERQRRVTQVPQASLSDLSQLSWNHEEVEGAEHRSHLAHQWIRDLVAHAALKQFCPGVGHLMAIALDLQNSEEVAVRDYSF